VIAHWQTREELEHQVVTLGKQGVTARAIARALGVSRNTVRAVRAAHEAGRETEQVAIPARPSRAPRPSKLDALKPRVAELISRFPDITAQRVLPDLEERRLRWRLHAREEAHACSAPAAAADTEQGDA